MVISYRHLDLFFQILLADFGALLGRAVFLGCSIQFHDGPAAEIYFVKGVKHGWKIDAALSEFDKAISALRVRRIRQGFNVLDVQEQEPISVLLNGFGRVAAALE